MPVADSLAQKGLSLPCSVGLTESEQDRVIAALREIAGGIIPSVTNCRETSIS
jgi:dTDP-4-amino-4,6-dideoxygalactose transaminase